jgi:hypothetical protein
MTDTLIDPQITDPMLDDEDPIFAHIIKGNGKDKGPKTMITEAIINGTPLEALCGFVWVPSRSVEGRPVCPKCAEIHKEQTNAS